MQTLHAQDLLILRQQPLAHAAGSPSLGKALLASLMGHPLAPLTKGDSSSRSGVAHSSLGAPTQPLAAFELTGKCAPTALAEKVRELSSQVCNLACRCGSTLLLVINRMAELGPHVRMSAFHMSLVEFSGTCTLSASASAGIMDSRPMNA